MAEQLHPDQLIAEAQKATGLERFDSDSFREGLEILVSDYNKQRAPREMQQRFNGSVVEYLSSRLQITDYLGQRPELLTRSIERPLVVLGLPRTGTTLLSNLLAADPARRVPLSWELHHPVPPATSATLYTDPRALARLEGERQALAANPGLGKYFRGSAVYPDECVYMLAGDFRSLSLESNGKLPNYRDWLFQCDMTSAYKYHKRFLQVLQADAPGTWSLKMPSHALWVETLLATYPDARLVWTHRDPLTAVGSFCSLIAFAHRLSVGTEDRAWIRDNCLWQAQQHLNRLMDSREKLGEDRMVDLHYAELMRDPIAAMRKLYRSLGDEFTEEAEAGMRAWLADNPQDKFGRHEYKLAEFGLTPKEVEIALERYIARYDVEPEGPKGSS